MGIVNISAIGLRCDICNFTWVPLEPNLPNECPSCHSLNWYKVNETKHKDKETKLGTNDEFEIPNKNKNWENGTIQKVKSNNKLNDLTGTQWIKFTKSWFIQNPPPRKETEILHPAKFPEALAKEFISFFCVRLALSKRMPPRPEKAG